ncbi:unnamed protein product [Trifolium pratense]|uniref:Uncharacterized protein n=2 Tax=Trifolium pratense TaxID=57577 RepID=A0ACB0JC10_TRIPR|nr:unnamed protein product [Trifolium pratense]CAJ2656768.1 unnamed protein product [Trifolium pratense]
MSASSVPFVTTYLLSSNLHASRSVPTGLGLCFCFHIRNLSTTLAYLFALPKMSDYDQFDYVLRAVCSGDLFVLGATLLCSGRFTL